MKSASHRVLPLGAAVIVVALAYLLHGKSSGENAAGVGPSPNHASGLDAEDLDSTRAEGAGGVERIQASDAESDNPTSDHMGPHTRPIPEKYRLPEVKPNMTTGAFLAEFWGERWPTVREQLGGDKKLKRFNVPLRDDGPLYRPIGTIEDFFVGLEARAIEQYRKTNRTFLFVIPSGGGATFLNPDGIRDALLSSGVFNPLGKKLSLNAQQSLDGVIAESSLSVLDAGNQLSDRWEQVIRECVQALVAYKPLPIGTVSLAPIMNNTNLLPFVQSDAGSYPLQYFSLPYVDAVDASTSGGSYSGILRIWPGDDSLLMSLYDNLHSENDHFRQAIQSFIESLPQ